MCAWMRVHPCVLHIIPIWLAAGKGAIPGWCSLKGCSPIGGSPSVCSPVRHSNLTDGGLWPWEMQDDWNQKSAISDPKWSVRARPCLTPNEWINMVPGLSWESFRCTSYSFKVSELVFSFLFFFPVFVCSTSAGTTYFLIQLTKGLRND